MSSIQKPNIQIWPIDRIKPYEQNAKLHEPDQVARIAASIRQFGWTQPIVVDKDGVIIAGHGRRLAGISLDAKEVPVWVRDDLGPEEVRALRLADNRVAESKIDTEMFRQELADLDFDLNGIFDSKELDFAIADLGDMNLGAFVDDVGAAVREQDASVKEATAAAAEKSVPIARVFGFKQVKGSNQLAITRLVAEIERITGVKGEDALATYSSQLLG